MENNSKLNIKEFLDKDEQKDLLRFLTAGSVDDGKSTLIGRLLFDSKKLYEDQLDALERDSKRMGNAGDHIDYALLLDGLKAERAANGKQCMEMLKKMPEDYYDMILMDIQMPKNYYENNDCKNKPLLLWRAHANNLYTNWLNYYVYQSTPFDLMGTPDFSSISMD